MSVAASDLVAYAAVNNPEDDVSTAGGAIDPNTRVIFTDLAVNDKVEVVSSSVGDTTPTATVRGRKADGTIASQTVTLNGTTAVLFGTNTFERILSFALNTAAVGTVTLRRQSAGATVSTVIPGELGFIRADISSISGGSGKDYYFKFFWKNNHGSLALLAAQVVQNSDPSGLCTFALENTVNDTHTIANRLTAPGNATAFSSATKTLATATGTADLASAAKIGVWIKMTLAANNPAGKFVYTSEIDGSTT